MAYSVWVIGGVTVPHVREVTINPQEGKISLECSALNWNIVSPNTDVRDEIAQFEALSSQYITNDGLLNGGTKLQVGNGQIITATDGTNTYTKCALEPVEIKEDHKSTRRIDYTLNLHYELTGSGGSYVYTPPYNKATYTNIEYYYYYDPGPPEVKAADTGALNGTEIGWMQITEAQNVKRVEIYGCGCDYPGSKIYVNDVERIWHYGEIPGTPGLATGSEKFTWDLTTPTDVITIKTTKHDQAGVSNLGAWLQWIRVVFE